MSNPLDLCTLLDVRQWLDTPASGLATATVTVGGAGYSSIVITAVPVDGNGTGATFTGVLQGGSLTSIQITNIGKDYTQAPLLVITGDGTGAVGTCTLKEEVVLSNLITRCSSMFNNELNRPSGIKSQTVTDKRHGNGGDTMAIFNWPVTAFAALSIDNVPINPSPDGILPGYLFGDRSVYLIGGNAWGPNGAGVFCRGRLNVSMTYTYGYVTVPNDIAQAVAELVAQKYKRRRHVDENGQTINGQTITFGTKDIPAEVMTTIYNYSIKAMIE